MNYRQFLNNFVVPYLIAKDKPFNRMLFNNAIDMAHRDKLITEKQAQNWTHPKTKHYV